LSEKLKKLVLLSSSSLRRLNLLKQKAEKILKYFELCSKLETQSERNEFYCTLTPKINKIDPNSLIATILLEQKTVGQEFSDLEPILLDHLNNRLYNFEKKTCIVQLECKSLILRRKNLQNENNILLSKMSEYFSKQTICNPLL
jgi:hypothetical protein